MPMLNSKFMTSSTGKQITIMQMLHNISISKGQPDYEIWSVNTTQTLLKKSEIDHASGSTV